MDGIAKEFFEQSLTGLPAVQKEALRAALMQPPVRALRLRPGVPLETVRRALPDEYAPVPWASGAYYIGGASRAGAHALHAAGAYYLQEPSAMAAVGALDVHPGQLVLDL
ncbi:MAG TPA: RNA methyltransferase, partial [Candidatus Aphodomonas merdavium]|nr:RNA methyltransferase [Candidatus Aphodomonas merdavium]